MMTSTRDFFKKIVITGDAPEPYYNDEGVLVMSVYDFTAGKGACDTIFEKVLK